jgi:hypothetical protein
VTFRQYIAAVQRAGEARGYTVTAEYFQHPQFGEGAVVYGRAEACGFYATVTLTEAVLGNPYATPEWIVSNWTPCTRRAERSAFEWRAGRYVPRIPARAVSMALERLV